MAARVTLERERRGLSYQNLSSEMRKTGCPINASALFKIEKGDPPRRITVDELVGFSRVFNLSIDQLLTPSDLLEDSRLSALVKAWVDAQRALGAAREEAHDTRAALDHYVHSDGDVYALLQSVIGPWEEARVPEDGVFVMQPAGTQPGMFDKLTEYFLGGRAGDDENSS